MPLFSAQFAQYLQLVQARQIPAPLGTHLASGPWTMLNPIMHATRFTRISFLAIVGVCQPWPFEPLLFLILSVKLAPE